MQNMVVTVANTTSVDLDQDLAILCFWNWNLLDDKRLVGFSQDSCLHSLGDRGRHRGGFGSSLHKADTFRAAVGSCGRGGVVVLRFFLVFVAKSKLLGDFLHRLGECQEGCTENLKRGVCCSWIGKRLANTIEVKGQISSVASCLPFEQSARRKL